MQSVAESPISLETLKVTVDDRVNDVVRQVEPDLLRGAITHATDGGKRIRPLLTMAACAAAGGQALDALDAGVAVELLHASSLVHDDIMDRSELRRGKKTVHTLYDTSTAILAGDVLIALAFQLLDRVQSPRHERVRQVLSNAFVHLCEGQSYDLHLSANEPPDRSLHRTMVAKKTAKLLEAAATMGALLGNPDEVITERLACFGFNIGMAYQAHDDLLDVVGDEGQTGKPAGMDIKNGKMTFLAFAHRGLGGTQGVTRLVEEYTAAAIESLTPIADSPWRIYLMRIANSLIGRSS